MKKFVLISAVILFQTVSYGQMWNKPEAVWSFSWLGISGAGQEKYTLHNDTIILGQNCKSLLNNYRRISYPEGSISEAQELSNIYFYEEDSIVYVFGLPGSSNVNFDTLYNFKSIPNDSWTFDLTSIPEYCPPNFTITVIDTGHVLLNQTSLYFLDVEYSYSFLDSVTILHDTIFESFGSKAIPFLAFPSICIPDFFEPKYYNLDCYSDNQISLGNECDFTIGISNVISTSKISVFPNPVVSNLSIENYIGNAILSDISGRFISSSLCSTINSQIDFSNVKEGIYILSLGNFHTRLVVLK
jgi:hypothetical protein